MSSRRRRAPAQEVSAGGVVVRDGEVAVIVPIKRAHDGSRVLALPKGHFGLGESALQAAEREVREETGIEVEAVGKSVKFFLFSYLGGDIADHDEEVEEVRWIGLREAQHSLTHAAEREIIGRALACLEEERKDR